MCLRKSRGSGSLREPGLRLCAKNLGICGSQELVICAGRD